MLEQVEEKLDEELFPETVEILFESESKEDLNSMISMLRLGGTEVPDVTDDMYEATQAQVQSDSQGKYCVSTCPASQAGPTSACRNWTESLQDSQLHERG